MVNTVCAALATVLLTGATTVVKGPDGTRWIEESVPAKDGVRLYTAAVAPAAGKCPTVVMRSPYVGEKRTDFKEWTKWMRDYTSRGYALVFQHCRGCGMSEGEWIPYDVEREDGLALLDFVRTLPWYNGEIFLSGGSYGASVHLSYLDTAPPDVKGARLTVQDLDRYNICYHNGFFKIALHGNWFTGGYKKKNRKLKRDPSVSYRRFPLCDYPRLRFGEEVPSLRNVIVHPRRDDPFWRSDQPGSGACFRDALAKSKIPVLLMTSFYDIYTDGVAAMWREMTPERRASCTLVINAYDHSGRPPKDPKSRFMLFPGGGRLDAGVDDLDWFDAIRKGTPCPNAPAGRTRYFALWENAWHEAEELSDGPRAVVLKIGGGARSFRYDPLRDPPTFPGSGGICFGGMRPQPPPSFRDDVLSFVLPPVSEQIDARGRMEAELSVASDCEDTCFYIRVSVDKGDGVWLVLRDSIASLASDAPYRPGERRTLRYRFADHAFCLSKGDRLRVDVSGASNHFAPHPNTAGDAFAEKNPRTAVNTVFADDSRLVIHAL